MAERGERGKPKDEPERIKQPTSVEELDSLLEKYKSQLIDDAKEALVESIKKSESRLIVDLEAKEDQLVREFTVSTVSVICRTTDGRIFMLGEGPRHTAPKGYTHLDLKNGVVKPIKIKDSRGHKDLSLSETTLAYVESDEAETPFGGAARGAIEEAFRTPLQDCGRGGDEKISSDFIQRKLRATRFQLNHRGKDDKKTRYEGLRSKVQDYNYVLEVNQDEISDSRLPITFNESGIPNILYEASVGKDGLVRYNEFLWREINETEYKVIATPRISFLREQDKPVDVAREVLKQIIRDDNKYGEDSYEARRGILDLSDVEIQTWEAFITDPVFVGMEYKGAKGFIMDKENYTKNWCFGRRKFHRRIIEQERKRIIRFSERLGYDQPTVIILRGNTAAGKTRFLRDYLDRPKAVITDGVTNTVHGVINPDTYKAYIKEETSLRLIGEQLLTEGDLLRILLENWALSSGVKKTELEEEIEQLTTVIFDVDPNFSIAFDRRFGPREDLERTVSKVEHVTNRHVDLVDIDTPLEQSLLWMFTRTVGGFESRVPFDDIKKGFVANRINRGLIIDNYIRGREWLQYRLFVTDENGELARKGDLVEIIDQSNPIQRRLYEEARAFGKNEADLELMADDIGGQTIKEVLEKIMRGEYKHLGKKINLIIETLSGYDENQTLAYTVTNHANKKA